MLGRHRNVKSGFTAAKPSVEKRSIENVPSAIDAVTSASTSRSSNGMYPTAR
ncbi:MAG: hypothetical protein U0166_18500 [Acidobacteriota bacterium]